MELTSLEVALLEIYRQTYATNGFPKVGDIRVVERAYSGNGSFTGLQADGRVEGTHRVLGIDTLIEVAGVPNGMGTVLFLEDGLLATLEIYVNGGDHWSGDLTGLRLVR